MLGRRVRIAFPHGFLRYGHDRSPYCLPSAPLGRGSHIVAIGHQSAYGVLPDFGRQ
jgi:hypothetical protein